MDLGVCMITVDFYPSVGGMQTHTLALAQHLQAIGVDTFVITRRYNNSPLYEEVGGLPIYRVATSPNASKIQAALQFIFGAINLLRQHRDRYQIIHCHQVISPTTIGLIGKELFRKKLIVNPHTPKQSGDFEIMLKRRRMTGKPRLAWMKQRGDAFIAISEEVQRDMMGMGFDPAKIIFIANGVDTRRFSPISPEEKTAQRIAHGLTKGPTLIYAGRLAERKQVDVLLRSFAGVLPKLPAEAQLLIVGDGEERQKLETLTESLGIQKQVKFIGPVFNVETYLQLSDIYILPSNSEGLPIALLEAMACGLPSLGSEIGGITDVIQPEVNGLLMPSGDVAALQQTLERLLFDEALAKRLGQQARQDMLQKYSIDNAAKKYRELYERLLHPKL